MRVMRVRIVPLRKAGGPFIGPRGGKWADAAHTIPWSDEPKKKRSRYKGGQKPLYKVTKRAGENLPAFENSQAQPGTMTALMESGTLVFHPTVRYETGEDGHQIRRTTLNAKLSERQKSKLIGEYEGLIKSEVQKMARRYRLDSQAAFDDLYMGGMEGMVHAMHSYPGGGPFAHYAQQDVKSYMAIAANQLRNGSPLPHKQYKNLLRYIRARAETASRFGVDNPSPRQVAEFWDLQMRHLHDGTANPSEQLPLEGTYRITAKRKEEKAGGAKVKSRVDMPGKLELAERFEDFLRGSRSTIELDDLDAALPGADVGRGLSPEDHTDVRRQVDNAMNALRDMGSYEMEMSTGKRTSKFRVDDLGFVMKQHLMSGKTATELAREVPIFKQRANGKWAEVKPRSAQDLYAKVLDAGMSKLKDQTQGRTKRLLEQAEAKMNPPQTAPSGPTYGEKLRQMGKTFSVAEVKAAQKTWGKGQTAAAVRNEMARRKVAAQPQAKVMRKLQSNFAEVERLDARRGVMTMYDPSTGKWSSTYVRLVTDHDFGKSSAFGGATSQDLHMWRHFPELTRLLYSQDANLVEMMGMFGGEA